MDKKLPNWHIHMVTWFLTRKREAQHMDVPDRMRLIAQRLDSQRSLEERMQALSELARAGQFRVDAYLRRRGITDGDVLADLSSEVWLILTELISDGRYCYKGIDPMAYVFQVTHNVLRHHLSRDKRLSGQIVTLDATLEESFADDEALVSVEEDIDLRLRFEELMQSLNSESDQQIAQLCWQERTPNQIAEELNLNIKTVRKGMRRIAEEVRVLRTR
jgi:RNA polymerase sigma factor (sigma-70 family)